MTPEELDQKKFKEMMAEVKRISEETNKIEIEKKKKDLEKFGINVGVSKCRQVGKTAKTPEEVRNMRGGTLRVYDKYELGMDGNGGVSLEVVDGFTFEV